MTGKPRPMVLALALFAVLTLSSGCWVSTSEPATAEKPTRSLGLALSPGPCLAGANVVSASAFVSGPAEAARYLEPSDGDLRFTLVREGEPPRPITVRWLNVANIPPPPLPGPPWNLELEFESAEAGACPIRVEFRPSPEAARVGLGAALTTMVMQEPPRPPAGAALAQPK